MKFEVKKAFMVLPLVAALAACGGGGGGGGASADGNVSAGGSTGTPTTGGTTGGTTTGGTTGGTSSATVTAFAKGSAPRYQFVGISQQTIGSADTLEQLGTGGVVTLNGNTLTGATQAVADVAGDATFALGRWSKGTATTSSGSALLESTVNNAYHYVVYNALAAFPASGSYSCDAGKFTSPSLVNGPSSVYFGKATGTAAISFSAAGASMDVAITATAGSQQGTVSVTGRPFSSPTMTAITGAYFGSGQGMGLTIGDAGNGKVRIVAGFTVSAGTSDYRGVGTFVCSPN
jgi:hypothetical protein